jgi:hypothetical protein
MVQGQGYGRNQGRGSLQGSGADRVSSRGRGRMGGKGLGPGGECVCPQCGQRAPHQRGVPCYQQLCPQCNTPMTRG